MSTLTESRLSLPRQARCFGLTMVELALVLAIIVLVAGIMVPLFWNGTGSLSVEGEAVQLQAQIAEVQHRAIATGQPHGLHFDTDDESVRVYWTDQSGQEQVISERSLDSKVDLATASFPLSRVEFDYFGTPSEGGLVTLTAANGASATVTVSPGTGLVTISVSGGKP